MFSASKYSEYSNSELRDSESLKDCKDVFWYIRQTMKRKKGKKIKQEKITTKEKTT